MPKTRPDIKHSVNVLPIVPRLELPRSEVRHFDLSGPDMIVLSATINRQTAQRNLMIPLLAEKLQTSGLDEDLLTLFIKTANAVRSNESAQVPEVRSTLIHKICLNKVFHGDLVYKSSVKLSVAQKLKQLF